ARNPRASLISVKHYMSRHIRERLRDTCERELAMHDQTFVGQAETLKQIQTAFDEIDSQSKAAAAENDLSVPAVGQRDDEEGPDGASDANLLPEVTASLKELLAAELHLEESEVDEDTQFTDLGLDSITGVTWLRKINAT